MTNLQEGLGLEPKDGDSRLVICDQLLGMPEILAPKVLL